MLSDKRDLIVMMNGMKTARKLLLGRPLNESLPVPPTTPHTTQTHTQSIPSTATTANKSEDINEVQKVPLYCFEALPGIFFGNTEEEDAFTYYAQCITTTYFHASGTCAMETDRCVEGNIDAPTNTNTSTGSALNDSSTSDYKDCDDNMAVVDVNLRVRGVSKLRVCDASVFPRIPSGPTSATCMAIAVSLGKLLQES